MEGSRSLMQSLCHRKSFVTNRRAAVGYGEQACSPNERIFPRTGFVSTAFGKSTAHRVGRKVGREWLQGRRVGGELARPRTEFRGRAEDQVNVPRSAASRSACRRLRTGSFHSHHRTSCVGARVTLTVATDGGDQVFVPVAARRAV